MSQFRDKVAVITGAASGIGLSLARALLHEGARVVLADLNQPGLEAAEKLLAQPGRTVSVVTDVSRLEQVEALAQRAQEVFGSVQMLFNNAGVTGGGDAWSTSPLDWHWILGVNLHGVIHGLQSFVPAMLAQNSACYIVNTASAISLLGDHPSAPYQVSKHAVLSLSENLRASLKGSQVQVSCLIPGGVRTGLLDCQQGRPEPLVPGSVEELRWKRHRRRMSLRLDLGMEPDEVAGLVLQALREGRFLIQTHPELTPFFRQRFENLLGDPVTPARPE